MLSKSNICHVMCVTVHYLWEITNRGLICFPGKSVMRYLSEDPVVCHCNSDLTVYLFLLR